MSLGPTRTLYSGQMSSTPTSASFAASTDAPEFVTIEGVELFAVGRWFPMTTSRDGQENGVTITQELLQAAVDAANDPEVQSARIKIGHTDPRFNSPEFDGDPAYGSISNIRLSADGMTLLGDFVNVPKGLADIMHSAYPARSIEADFNHKTPSGKTYDFVVTATSLLGASPPAVTCLQDILESELYMARKNSIAATTISAAEAVSDQTVRQAYYESLTAEQMWWWIRSIHVSPAEIIVDDDAGQLYRVPYTINSKNEVSFADPIPVHIEYVNEKKINAAQLTAFALAACPGRPVAIYATRSESRPPNTNQEEGMDPKLIRTTLGLAEDATDEQVLARMAELNASQETAPTGDEDGTDKVPTPAQPQTPATPTTPNEDEQPAEPATPAPTTPEVPEGMALIDQTALKELQVAASRANQLFAAQQRQDRDSFLDSAVKAGKFAPSRKAHFAALYDADPEGTKATIEKLAAGVVPVGEVGITGDGGETPGQSKEAYPASWFPELAARNGDHTGGANSVIITQGV